MVYLVSIHPVGDYDVWKAEVNRVRAELARFGVTRQWLYRGTDDRNEIMSVLELPSVEHAERLMRSAEADIPGLLDRSGLEIYPTFFLGEQVEVREYSGPPDV